MLYAICNPNIESDEVLTVFKAKKISKENVYPVQNFNALLSRLRTGDTVLCSSIVCFGSVSLYARVATELFRGGVALRSINEPYLDIGKGRCWKPQTEQMIKSLIRLEMKTVQRLVSMGVNKAGQEYIISVMKKHDIRILADTFSAEGILHR